MSTDKRVVLYDVVAIRLLLIVLLVFFHAFAVFSEGLDQIFGYPEIPVYRWADKFSIAFFLETFVFISGYVYGYQVRIKGDGIISFKKTIIGKFKRLILPSIIFGLLYVALFGDKSQSINQVIYSVINGKSHLWFLQMLFWCFVSLYIIFKLHLSQKIVFPILIVCALFSRGPLPLQINHTMYYMLFFYICFLLQRNNISIEKFLFKRKIIVLIICFITVFILLTLFRDWFNMTILRDSLSNRVINKTVNNFSQLICASLGVISVYLTTNYILKKQVVTDLQIKISSYCFGVYLINDSLKI